MATRSDVLEALREAGADGLSGETLAARLGVSRVAVSKHVSALRELGYRIDAVAGRGYELVAPPDLPLPAEVQPLLRSTFWTRLEGGGETGSTNDDARVLASAGAFEGTAVLASRQTAGRGRLGRTWESPDGGVYLSAVLRPAVEPSRVASLALAVALGVVIGLERLGVSARLKWPNDVLLNGGKLAGVLLEMTAEPDRVDRVVAGVGLNVRRPSEPIAENAAYVSDVAPGVTLAEAAAAELDGVAETYGRWCRGGFSAVRADYETRFSLTGCEVRVSDVGGSVRAAGVVTGVDDDGRLLLRDGEDEVAVVAGEVTLRR
jgi:BirA family biotin operon repressor/biotin-[acetyl-CoA-carboxylase] ligase